MFRKEHIPLTNVVRSSFIQQENQGVFHLRVMCVLILATTLVQLYNLHQTKKIRALQHKEHDDVEHLPLDSKDTKANVLQSSSSTLMVRYLIGFLLSRAADWMQGPYAYAVYSSCNLTSGGIGILFLKGYASGSLLGPLCGVAADTLGRKRMCLVYCVLSCLFAISMYQQEFALLFLGRICSGIASSIMHSCFEAWLIRQGQVEFGLGLAESTKAPPEFDTFISQVFQISTLLNGMIAVLCGIVSSLLAVEIDDRSPFGASIFLLVLCFIYVFVFWEENFGEENGELFQSLKASINLLWNEPIMVVGFTQVCFEASLYLFVFLWTPALKNGAHEETPLGIVFACFMLCISMGSSLFNLMSGAKRLLRGVFLAAAVSMMVPIFFSNHDIRLISFCIFEMCTGMYHVGISTLRQKVLPEAHRSAIMTIYRIPQNCLVALGLSLVQIPSTSETHIFLLCSTLLLLGATVSHRYNSNPI
eukprot:TRINITY_DN4969_c0_g1_i2.p1 TRINITY_DN4969_c0_g1~~TRINITY_DN4969_c0_g1_i2.p1  ORF type:complete len:475 (+),score=75.36 TRINITY_DN4969_c0_g1_i2:42-1466(+)